jgi:polyferredoxin
VSYPIAGAASVAVNAIEGKCPKDAGFSFLPEVIVFLAASFGLATLIDYFAMPWGRRTVGGLCVVVIIQHLYIIVRGIRRIRSTKKRPSR